MSNVRDFQVGREVEEIIIRRLYYRSILKLGHLLAAWASDGLKWSWSLEQNGENWRRLWGFWHCSSLGPCTTVMRQHAILSYLRRKKSHCKMLETHNTLHSVQIIIRMCNLRVSYFAKTNSYPFPKYHSFLCSVYKEYVIEITVYSWGWERNLKVSKGIVIRRWLLYWSLMDWSTLIFQSFLGYQKRTGKHKV